jgi:DNA-binding IclR family transcriptional regulator
MATGLDPNKAKTARRVIEVLEFFDEQTRHATAMDIARRYRRPQSSTFELLSIMVEMGVLYKDPVSRLFKPTPRAAMLGSMFQPRLVRDGRLSALADSLRAATGLATAVMGLVGLDAQIFRWIPGATPIAATARGGLCGGAQSPLHRSAAGWLLLSTVSSDRRGAMLRRLRASSPADQMFSIAEISEQIAVCGDQGVAVGPAGFGDAAQTCSILLPMEAGERPMVLALVYEPGETVDPAALTALLQGSVQRCVDEAMLNVVDLERYRSRGGGGLPAARRVDALESR